MTEKAVVNYVADYSSYAFATIALYRKEGATAVAPSSTERIDCSTNQTLMP